MRRQIKDRGGGGGVRRGIEGVAACDEGYDNVYLISPRRLV